MLTTLSVYGISFIYKTFLIHLFCYTLRIKQTHKIYKCQYLPGHSLSWPSLVFGVSSATVCTELDVVSLAGPFCFAPLGFIDAPTQHTLPGTSHAWDLNSGSQNRLNNGMTQFPGHSGNSLSSGLAVLGVSSVLVSFLQNKWNKCICNYS